MYGGLTFAASKKINLFFYIDLPWMINLVQIIIIILYVFTLVETEIIYNYYYINISNNKPFDGQFNWLYSLIILFMYSTESNDAFFSDRINSN